MKIGIVGEGKRYIDLDVLLASIGKIPEGQISEYDAGRWDVRQVIMEQPVIMEEEEDE